MADDQSWACKQIPNGQNPIVVCEREALCDELVRLRAVLDAVDALHTPYKRTPECQECELQWPCPTHLLIHPDVPA